MSCSACGNPGTPTRYQVILDRPDSDDHPPIVFLSEVEARVYATAHGGGRIEQIR